jgi:outer membrane PBP1 activator LpoA protein
MMAMVNAMPNVMAIAADKIVEAQDWAGASEIARRLRTQLPPGMISEQDMSEEELAIVQQNAEQAQQQQQLQMQALQLEMADKEVDVMLKRARAIEAEARAIESRARAQQAEALAAKAIADIELNRVAGAMDVIDKMHPEPAGNSATNR